MSFSENEAPKFKGEPMDYRTTRNTLLVMVALYLGGCSSNDNTQPDGD